MPLMKSLARAMVPADSRHKFWQLNQYRSCFPMKTALSRDMMRLEFFKSARPLDALNAFPELQDSAWKGLESLAYQIVLRHRPKVIVELGTHMGLSALAMSLALKKLGEGGRLFAIDCWEGDPQAGHYGDEVYDTFLRRRAELGLEETIVPLKMFFDEAKDQVATPIDLLHIDGLHTWEAVNHDWDTYGPLVAPGGLVMFHDIFTEFEDLRRFWAGISSTSESHTVPYSNGLGIIRTGS